MGTIRISPISVTHWDEEAEPQVFIPDNSHQLTQLRDAFEAGRTLWIETKLTGLNNDQDKWIKGEFDIWRALPTPLVDWSVMEPVLEAVDLPVPAPRRVKGEQPSQRLLRTLPYAYTRGAFGTVRDALSDADDVAELALEAPSRQLTVMPTAGFIGTGLDSDGLGLRYTVLHATIGVFGQVVVSVRLPDAFCPNSWDGQGSPCPAHLVEADVLTRFLPMRRMPTGREVAEAIGMHQATSARCVANLIRDNLNDAEALATPDAGDEKDGAGEDGDAHPATPDAEMITAATAIEGFNEIAHQLDRYLSTLLRRFSGELPDAPGPAKELVPAEVRRRYRFALDNVHLLHEDCRLAAEVVRGALATYERDQREQFQFVAALLASIVLIPTLLAGVFGANLNVPARDNDFGFPVFVLVLVALAVTGGLALHKAWKHKWRARPREFVRHGIAASIILAAFIAFLILA